MLFLQWSLIWWGFVSLKDNRIEWLDIPLEGFLQFFSFLTVYEMERRKDVDQGMMRVKRKQKQMMYEKGGSLHHHLDSLQYPFDLAFHSR